MAKSKKIRNKGDFIGSFMEPEQIGKITEVEKLFDKYFGDVGRNRSKALRYIIDQFNMDELADFPKDQAPVGMNA